jgi:hypothetical protein
MKEQAKLRAQQEKEAQKEAKRKKQEEKKKAKEFKKQQAKAQAHSKGRTTTLISFHNPPRLVNLASFVRLSSSTRYVCRGSLLSLSLSVCVCVCVCCERSRHHRQNRTGRSWTRWQQY